MVRVNLSAAEQFEVLPAGAYPVVVTDGEIRQSGEDSKHPDAYYVNWELTVHESHEYAGRKVWWNTGLTHYDHDAGEGCECDEEDKFNKWLAGTAKLAELAGIDTSQDDYEFDVDDFVGTTVVAVVSVQPYQGEDRNNVKRIRPAGDLADASVLP